MSTKQLIVGNWKMNGTILVAEDFINDLLNRELNTNTEAVICPPVQLIYLFKEKMKGTNIELGAQDCYFEIKGAFTGDVSAEMLKDVGCKYVILGHSERRAKHYETNYLINKKAIAVQKAGLTPIICVGETKQEKNEGKAQEIISKQVKFSLPKDCTIDNVIIAYEPVWSIGTGEVPTNEDIINTLVSIRETLKAMFNEDMAKNVKILYGGSVNKDNSKEILSLEGVNGALVGGASLKSEDFSIIINNSKY